ncbi:MAG: hypothetical protein EXS14_10520 [Planctomycetes bacterium]|nr:hypothetical protein [Planctomycetota bacterium]
MRLTICLFLLALLSWAQDVPVAAVDFAAIEWPGEALPENAVSFVKPTESAELLVGEFPPAENNRHVVDGDTLRVAGNRQSLRLVGLDTEETFKDKGEQALAEKNWPEYIKTVTAGANPNRPPKYASPMGEAARSFAQHFFKDVKVLRVELDDIERGIDYYGRRLSHVLVQKSTGWVNFNVEVVRQGLSPYFVKYGRTFRHHAAFVAAEQEAKTNKLGIWGEPPRHAAYPDYPIRLRWWQQRDVAIQKAIALEKATPTLVLLGLDREWTQACGAEGQQVTVIGSVGKLRHAGKGLGLLPFGHRNQSDFLLVGKHSDLEKHALIALEGDIVMITGTLRLYEGRPQFKLDEGVTVRSPADN